LLVAVAVTLVLLLLVLKKVAQAVLVVIEIRGTVSNQAVVLQQKHR